MPYEEPTNEDRANWALAALEAFEGETRTDRECALSDLLADLRHLADRAGEDWDALLAHADMHYREEIEEDMEDEPDPGWASEFPHTYQDETTVGPQRGDIVRDATSGRLGVVLGDEVGPRAVKVKFEGDDEPILRYWTQIDVMTPAIREVG